MKTWFRGLAVALMTAASLAVAAGDFPEGSPDFKDSLGKALAASKENGKPVVAVFSAIWCGPCHKMKNDVYPSAAVKAYHDKFNWAYIDVDEAVNKPDVAKFSIQTIPSIQFLDKTGAALTPPSGYAPADGFVKKLDEVLQKAAAGAPAAAAPATTPPTPAPAEPAAAAPAKP